MNFEMICFWSCAAGLFYCIYRIFWEIALNHIPTEHEKLEQKYGGERLQQEKRILGYAMRIVLGFFLIVAVLAVLFIQNEYYKRV